MKLYSDLLKAESWRGKSNSSGFSATEETLIPASAEPHGGMQTSGVVSWTSLAVWVCVTRTQWMKATTFAGLEAAFTAGLVSQTRLVSLLASRTAGWPHTDQEVGYLMSTESAWLITFVVVQSTSVTPPHPHPLPPRSSRVKHNLPPTICAHFGQTSRCKRYRQLKYWTEKKHCSLFGHMTWWTLITVFGYREWWPTTN